MSLERQRFRYLSCRGNYLFVYISAVFKNTKYLCVFTEDPLGEKSSSK